MYIPRALNTGTCIRQGDLFYSAGLHRNHVLATASLVEGRILSTAAWSLVLQLQVQLLRSCKHEREFRLVAAKVLQIVSSHHLIYPLTARVVGAPQMISQPVSSIYPCSPLPSGTSRTPGLSIPWCCLPSSSSVCLVFFPLSLCLARWFWPDLMNGRHDHTTAVCVS